MIPDCGGYSQELSGASREILGISLKTLFNKLKEYGASEAVDSTA